MNTDEWEQLGEIMLSRELAAFRSLQHDLIAGFFLIPSLDKRWGKPAYVNFVFADNHVFAVPIRLRGGQTAEYTDMVDADRLCRRELGLSEPPDYAAMIREYTETAGRR